jgi:hypothetical protein
MSAAVVHQPRTYLPKFNFLLAGSAVVLSIIAITDTFGSNTETATKPAAVTATATHKAGAGTARPQHASAVASAVVAAHTPAAASRLVDESRAAFEIGSKVVAANKSSSPNPSPRRQAGALRSNLTRPQPHWWAAKQREGLSIRTLTEDEMKEKLERMPLELVVGEKWWTVEYSKKYKSMTMAFIQIVLSGSKHYCVSFSTNHTHYGLIYRSRGILGLDTEITLAR